MPHPDFPPEPWQSLLEVGKLPLREAVQACLRLPHDFLIITTGAHPLPLCVRELGLPRVDVCRYFPSHSQLPVPCSKRTAFSDDALYSSYGSLLWDAEEAVMQIMRQHLLEHGDCAHAHHPFACVLNCQHGLHRSQATARFLAETWAFRGSSSCVLNASTFHRQWCDPCFRVLEKPPNDASVYLGIPQPVG